jgi:hypothetical protein
MPGSSKQPTNPLNSILKTRRVSPTQSASPSRRISNSPPRRHSSNSPPKGKYSRATTQSGINVVLDNNTLRLVEAHRHAQQPSESMKALLATSRKSIASSAKYAREELRLTALSKNARTPTYYAKRYFGITPSKNRVHPAPQGGNRKKPKRKSLRAPLRAPSKKPLKKIKRKIIKK